MGSSRELEWWLLFGTMPTSAPELIEASLGLMPIIIFDGCELELMELYLAAGVSPLFFPESACPLLDGGYYGYYCCYAVTWLDYPILMPLPCRVIFTLGFAWPPMTISSLTSLIVLFWLSLVPFWGEKPPSCFGSRILLLLPAPPPPPLLFLEDFFDFFWPKESD